MTAGERRPGSPIIERAPAPKWKLVLVVMAAAFAFWQLRDLTDGGSAVRQPAAQAPVAREVARPAALAFESRRVDPRAPAIVRGDDTAQDAVLALVGQTFASLAALDEALAVRQFARIGRFGEVWPATVVQARTGFESVELEHAGQVHRYTGFTSADLLALTLAGAGDEPVSVVYRRLREPGR